MENYNKLIDKYPFMAVISYGGTEYVGIIQNKDDQMTTIYDFGALRTSEEKSTFLELAQQWWDESNRLLPINIFLKRDWDQFKDHKKTFMSKDVEVKVGHVVDLKSHGAKRTKKRSITLVRKPI